MTPPAHCGHECVCPYKLQGSKDFCQTSCEFDTRSRPAPQQPELSELVERLTIPVGRYKGFINAAMLMQHIGLHQVQEIISKKEQGYQVYPIPQYERQ